MQLTIEHESKLISFQLEYRKRRTIEIRIQPPDTIRVLAPAGLAKGIIINEVKKKAEWICKKLEEYQGLHYVQLKKSYVDGETLLYLGKPYYLKIIDADNKIPRVTRIDNILYVYASSREEEKLKKAIEKWYRQEMVKILGERIQLYQQYFKVMPSGIVVKEQKQRWGSCTSKRKLLFNWKLIMAPIKVIDYVVVHEMCHMVHMNHSKDFWNLVEDIVSDYKEHKKWLKLNGILLDN
jgi:predicted metal-dependent hydrolase